MKKILIKLLSVLICTMLAVGVVAPVKMLAAEDIKVEGSAVKAERTANKGMKDTSEITNLKESQIMMAPKSTRAVEKRTIQGFKPIKVYSDTYKFTWTNTPGANKYAVVYSNGIYTYGPYLIKKDKEYRVFDLTKDKGEFSFFLYSYDSYDSFLDSSYAYKVTPSLSAPKIKSIGRKGVYANVKFHQIANMNPKVTYTLYQATSKTGTYKKGSTDYRYINFWSKKLKRNKSYYYKIKVIYKGEGSDLSKASAAKGIKIPKLKTPTKLKASKVKKSSAQITYKIPTDGYKYYFYLKGGKNKKFKKIATFKNVKGIKLSGLHRKTTYQVKIKVADKYGYKSGYSKTVKFKTK